MTAKTNTPALSIITAHIEKNGMSCSELSRRSGVPYSRLRRIITGKTRLLAKDFVALCKALDIDAI